VRHLISAIVLILFLSPVSIFADNAGSRGSFTRGGWAGAGYIASGMSGVVMCDDIFSIYWNPAGLSELKSRKKMSEEKISQKAKEGKYGDISEDDLLNFSESDGKNNFFDIGASYTQLDIERDAAFSGCAFGLFNGVIGFGLYTIISNDIETRDADGNLTGETKYTGAEGFISYSWSSSIYSIGLSVKPVYERIADSTYGGIGADIGVQVFVLPFIKVGVIARDLGTFLKPLDSNSSEDEYDFFEPEIAVGLSFITDSGITLAATTFRRLEQNKIYVGGGIEYDITSYLTLAAGMFDESFTTGFELSFSNKMLAYSLSFDRIDGGYNNTVSVELIF